MEQGLHKQSMERGFTLMEILIALFIFSVIAGTLSVAYRALFSGADRLKGEMRRYAMVQTCFMRMQNDFQAIQVVTAPLYKIPEPDDATNLFRVLGQTSFFSGTEFGTLWFASLAHVPAGVETRTGIARIGYYVHKDTDQTFILKRADRLYPFPESSQTHVDPILCEDIKALRFTYYDIAGSSYESWDSDSADYHYATPASIAIEMTIGDDDSSTRFKTRIALPVVRAGRDLS